MKRIFSTVLVLAAVVLFANAKVGLVGNFQGWNTAEAVVLTESAEGVFEADVPLLDDFKFLEDVDGVFAWGNTEYGSAGEQITLGEACGVAVGGGNFNFANRMKNAVNCHVVLNLNEMTLLVTGTEGEFNTGDDVYSLVGAFQGWDAEAGDYDFTHVGGTVYSLDMPQVFLEMDEVTLPTSEFKVVCNHAWGPVNWAGNGEDGLVVDFPYELVCGNDPKNLFFSEGSELTADMKFWFDLEGSVDDEGNKIATLQVSVEAPEAVNSVKAEALNGNVYNVAGVCVARNANSLNGLAKGLYILNGKKYIVK